MLAEMMAKRVANGVALLDERVPGWRENVDRDTLVMESLGSCILAQVFDDWGIGCNELDIAGDRDAQVHYGFDLTHEEYTELDTQAHWYELEGAWYSELKK